LRRTPTIKYAELNPQAIAAIDHNQKAEENVRKPKGSTRIERIGGLRLGNNKFLFQND
jgi:hypothetical protein